jgi:hypothetical protein
MLRPAIVAALVAAALAAPPAWAQDLRSPDARTSQPSGTPAVQDLRSPDARVEEAPVIVRPESGGFDWVSAAIGVAAGTGFMLAIVAALGLLGISDRRRDQIHPVS